MVIAYDPNEANDGRRRGARNLAEEAYFSRYRMQMMEWFYGGKPAEDSETAEQSEEAQTTDPQAAASEGDATDKEMATDETVDDGFLNRQSADTFSAMRFAMRLLHFFKSGEGAPEEEEHRKLTERRRRALLRELENPDEAILQVGRDYFDPGDLMHDYFMHLIDFCFSESRQQQHPIHPFRRDGIATWPDLSEYTQPPPKDDDDPIDPQLN